MWRSFIDNSRLICCTCPENRRSSHRVELLELFLTSFSEKKKKTGSSCSWEGLVLSPYPVHPTLTPQLTETPPQPGRFLRRRQPSVRHLAPLDKAVRGVPDTVSVPKHILALFAK